MATAASVYKFYLPKGITLEANTRYAIVVTVGNCSVYDGSNYIALRYKNPGNYSGGRACKYDSAWSELTESDFYFVTYYGENNAVILDHLTSGAGMLPLTNLPVGQASGVASLNASAKVVEDPANATVTPTANKIPIADGNGDLNIGWIPATAVPAPNKIPIANASGKLDSWITGSWEKVYDNIISTPITDFNISTWDNGESVDGNTDQMLMCLILFKNLYNGSAELGVRPNDDSGNNYSRQILDASGTSVVGSRGTINRFALNWGYAQNFISWSQSYIYLRAGKRRVCNSFMQNTSINDVIYISVQYQWWTNTLDNITALKFVGSQANCIGAGSHIVIFRKRG